MKAANITHAAALPYGLAVARAVGRNAHHLRQALALHNGGCGTVAATLCGVPTADLVKLNKAGLVDLTRDARQILVWALTAEGRTLAGRL